MLGAAAGPVEAGGRCTVATAIAMYGMVASEVASGLPVRAVVGGGVQIGLDATKGGSGRRVGQARGDDGRRGGLQWLRDASGVEGPNQALPRVQRAARIDEARRTSGTGFWKGLTLRERLRRFDQGADEPRHRDIAGSRIDDSPDAVSPDAVPLADLLACEGASDADNLLPDWYMPAPAGRPLQGWRRGTALAIVVSFLVPTVYGICSAYGLLGLG